MPPQNVVIVNNIFKSGGNKKVTPIMLAAFK
jgi:hypothetical protein